MRTWHSFVVSMLLLGALAAGVRASPPAAPAQQDAYVITYPTNGATVSGSVEIRGSVAHPNFASYGVFYAPGPTPTGDSRWVRIAFESQPVVDGVLAVWDTTALPDGLYTLALARYQQGSGGPDEPLFFVTNITVYNQGAVPTPTETPTLPPMPTAVDTTPTPVPIEQPPTATPYPTATLAPGETPSAVEEEEEEEGGFSLDMTRLRGAFMDGAKITLLLFGLWGLYTLSRAIIRYLIRTRGAHLIRLLDVLKRK